MSGLLAGLTFHLQDIRNQAYCHVYCYQKKNLLIYLYFINFRFRYMVHFAVGTGGYRNLLNGQSYYRQNIYSQVKTENSMQLHFDYEEPIHCSEDDSCTSGESPFLLSHDIANVNICELFVYIGL